MKFKYKIVWKNMLANDEIRNVAGFLTDGIFVVSLTFTFGYYINMR